MVAHWGLLQKVKAGLLPPYIAKDCGLSSLAGEIIRERDGGGPALGLVGGDNGK